MEPFGSPVSEACSNLSGSYIVCFISLIGLNFHNRALRVCDPLSNELRHVAVELLKCFSLIDFVIVNMSYEIKWFR